MNYTIDTNIITAIIKNNEKIKRKLQETAFYSKEVFINGISYYEIKRGLLTVNATKQLNIFDEICKKFRILWLDNQEIFDRASEIYADLKQRGELITQNLILVTDDNDFLRIRGITVENWLRIES
ncbi:MAG: hypothetical protein ACE5J9_03745 [Methanosarcinales archaeon]